MVRLLGDDAIKFVSYKLGKQRFAALKKDSAKTKIQLVFYYLVHTSNVYFREIDEELALINVLSLLNALDNPCDTDHMRFWVTQ
jgi:hypothetical protein